VKHLKHKGAPKPNEARENELLLREAKKIVEALGKMFAPCCEVLLHDLRNPDNSIIAIECPISGRRVGEATTEMGRARIADRNFPEVVQNYPNTFPDGRPAKSTSIGLRNSTGDYVAAICLNLDVSLFTSVQNVLERLTRADSDAAPVRENLKSFSNDELKRAVEAFSADCNLQPRALSPSQRRMLINRLNESGLLQLRNGASQAAELLGITRASVYNALKRNASDSRIS
jgi:predicted transcriptional regulator YheO